MKKENGFTLIELLAVIVILSIIALITIPIHTNVIETAKKNAFKDTTYNIIDAGRIYFTEQQIKPEGMNSNAIFNFPDDNNDIKLEGKMPESGTMIVNKEGKVAIAVSDGNYCVTKGYDDSDVTVTENTNSCIIPSYKDPILNGADPVLKTGMIPVKIEADGTVKKADVLGAWYNYTNKEWANVVMVTEESRKTYEDMEEGNQIKEEDILTYFVWIPRYKYKLWYVEATDGSTSLDTSKIESIDIVFENKATEKSNGTCEGTYENPTNNCYLTHPAFTFGEEVNGIWVGKFETGYNGATTTTEAQIQTADTSKIIIKPNTYSWRDITASNMYATVKGMNEQTQIFGISTDSDTHAMKNTEWGAVAYLSHSKYGKDSEIYINNSKLYQTGCSGDTVYEGGVDECKNPYGSKKDNIYNQSTTGNISGIFDMSGCAWEFVISYNENATKQYGSSGFTAETFPTDKYIDIYNSTTDTQYSKRILGDATGEMGPFASSTISWYNDAAYFLDTSSPWYKRGGSRTSTTSGGIFAFDNTKGSKSATLSFRIVLI